MTARIKVDIDGRLPASISDKVHWVFGIMKLRVLWYSFYRTNRGWHLEIETARRVHPWRIVALQAILGSDYRRELFNLRRTGNWRNLPAVARERWNVLFLQKHTL